MWLTIARMRANDGEPMPLPPNSPIFIGAKPPMNYVLAIVSQFSGGSADVVLKARGHAISRAVDVAEIVRGRFVEDAYVRDIRIGTERIAGDRGRMSNVSSIEIVLTKDPAAKLQHVIPATNAAAVPGVPPGPTA